MKSKLLIKLGAPVLALSLIAACGTADNEDPADTNEAPLNQEDDNNNQNPVEDGDMNDGDNGGMNNGDEGLMEEDGNTENNGNNDDNTNTDGLDDTPLGEDENQK